MPVSKKQLMLKEALALGIPATQKWTMRELQIRINMAKTKRTPLYRRAEEVHANGGETIHTEGEKSSDPTAGVETTTVPAIVDKTQNIAKLRQSTFADILKANQSEEDHSPHVMVTARAGTGKTTTLIKGAGLLVDIDPGITPSPQQQAVWDAILMSKGKAKNICFATLTNTIADELKRRVPTGMHAYTFHQIGRRAVVERFKLLPGEGAINKFRVDKILEELYGKSIWDLRREKGDVIKLTKELVSLCKMNLVGTGDEDWEHAITELALQYEINIPALSSQEIYKLVPSVLERCKEVDKDQCIDFNDMIWLPVVLNLPVYKYDILFGDEWQDANRCQQELALKAGKRLILCGDPRQSIYGFAGADSQSMSRMYQILNAPMPGEFGTLYGAANLPIVPGVNVAKKCLDLRLTVTRRCGRAIVKEANQIEPDFEAHESNSEGKVSYAQYTSKRLRGGTVEVPVTETYLPMLKAGDMVLCMINAPLVEQCFKMIKMGIQASIRGRKIGDNLVQLIESLKPANVNDLITKLSSWKDDEVAKLQAEKYPSETKITSVMDRHDTLRVFTGQSGSIEEMVAKIKSYFTDDKQEGVSLSSGHKAKGLEAKRVFFLDIWSPSKKKKLPEWEREQLENLRYVMITRAEEELIYVT